MGMGDFFSFSTVYSLYKERSAAHVTATDCNYTTIIFIELPKAILAQEPKNLFISNKPTFLFYATIFLFL